MNKFVEEAPYHPGYEDAVIGDVNYHEHESRNAKMMNELLTFRARHLATAAKIIEFMKGGERWER